MHVQVKDSLPGVNAGVHDQTISGLVDAFLLCQLSSHGKQVTEQGFISFLYIIY
jgi:hypothetical protein